MRAPCVLLRILCPPDPQCLNLSCPGLSPDCLCTTTAPTGIGCRPLFLHILFSGHKIIIPDTSIVVQCHLKRTQHMLVLISLILWRMKLKFP